MGAALSIKSPGISIIVIAVERKKEGGKTFKDIMAENFSNLVKNIALYLQESLVRSAQKVCDV